MSRGLVDDLGAPVPLGSLLPAIYRDLDPNVIRLTEALDTVLAPVWLCLDNIDCYFDPATAPADFLSMLVGWVGLPLDQNWSDDQVRALAAQAVELYRWRGTQRGIVALVEAYLGVTPVIEETGGAAWFVLPDTRPATVPEPAVRIRVDLAHDGSEDLIRLTRLIANYLPAHVAVSVEIARPGPPSAPAPAPEGENTGGYGDAPPGDAGPQV